jgi:hypothetical protein
MMSQALGMAPQAFQELIDIGNPIVLIGHSEPINFDISTLFGLMDFRSDALCIGELSSSFHWGSLTRFQILMYQIRTKCCRYLRGMLPMRCVIGLHPGH